MKAHPTKQDYAFRKQQKKDAYSTISDASRTTYELDSDGLHVNKITNYGTAEHPQLAKRRVGNNDEIVYPGERHSLESCEKSIKAIVRNLVKGVIEDAPIKEIERQITQLTYTQEKMMTRLDEGLSPIDKEICVELCLAQNLENEAGEILDVVLERLQEAGNLADNKCLANTVRRLSEGENSDQSTPEL